MEHRRLTASGKPYDLHERLLLLACDIVNAVQFLHKRGPIGRAFSYQLLSAGTSVGANYEEGDGASSHDDFIAKNRIALKEAKESRFRLRVCRRCELLDQAFDPLVRESDELVRILGKVVHTALARKVAREAAKLPRSRAQRPQS
jgi:four helix bundle protein